jgi:hypothetical protein
MAVRWVPTPKTRRKRSFSATLITTTNLGPKWIAIFNVPNDFSDRSPRGHAVAPQPQERTPLKDAARVYADRTSAAIVRLIATCNSRVQTPHTPQRPQTWTSWRALTHHAHHRGPEALCGVACAACVPQMGESWNHRYGSPLITPESTSGAALEAAFKARRNASPAASAVRP